MRNRSFRDLPLTQKMFGVILAASGATLLITSVAIVTYELTFYQPLALADLEAQVEILAWMLVLLRWLQQGGRRAPGSRISFQEDVNREVMRHRRRLKVPVLVLFSRADELNDLPLPGSSRSLYPVGESPLLLAYHRLPRLLEVLATHVDHFRLDFVHSLVTDHDTGEIVDPEACGVSLSLAWLLDGSWRWPTLPTRHWIAWQRFVDAKIRGDDRWERLPPPADVV